MANRHIHEGATGDPTLKLVTSISDSSDILVVLAGQHVRTNLTPFSVTLSATAQSVSSSTAWSSSTTHADIYAEGGSSTDFARFWDGGTPSNIVGMKLRDHELWESASPSTFRAVVGSGTVTLRVQPFYYA